MNATENVQDDKRFSSRFSFILAHLSVHLHDYFKNVNKTFKRRNYFNLIYY